MAMGRPKHSSHRPAALDGLAKLLIPDVSTFDPRKYNEYATKRWRWRYPTHASFPYDRCYSSFFSLTPAGEFR